MRLARQKIMVRSARPFRLVVLIVALLPGFLTGATVEARQSGTVASPYKAELLDWNIVVTGPNYIFERAALEEYPHGRGERVYIAHVDSLGFVEISFFDDEDTPEQTIDLMLRDFEAASNSVAVLDRGERDGVYYALARFDLGGSLVGYFYIEVAEDIEGNVDFAQSIYTLNADLTEQIDIARSEITMQGYSFLSEPVTDLPVLIAEDKEVLASTPEPIATPQRGEYTFPTQDAEMSVDAPIEYDFPYTNNQLEVMFLRSEHGYGIVGFIQDDTSSAERVVGSMFIGAPTGSEAPVELFLEANDDRALGVYRVQTQGETRVMVIEVVRLEEELWRVQAMAVSESQFEAEFDSYNKSVTFDGEPFLNEVEVDLILEVLAEN